MILLGRVLCCAQSSSIRYLPGVGGPFMTVTPRTELLSQVIERRGQLMLLRERA